MNNNSSRRSIMSESLLGENHGGGLTMAMVGCLPDNVQQVS